MEIDSTSVPFHFVRQGLRLLSESLLFRCHRVRRLVVNGWSEGSAGRAGAAVQRRRGVPSLLILKISVWLARCWPFRLRLVLLILGMQGCWYANDRNLLMLLPMKSLPEAGRSGFAQEHGLFCSALGAGCAKPPQQHMCLQQR